MSKFDKHKRQARTTDCFDKSMSTVDRRSKKDEKPTFASVHICHQVPSSGDNGTIKYT